MNILKIGLWHTIKTLNLVITYKHVMHKCTHAAIQIDRNNFLLLRFPAR